MEGRVFQCTTDHVRVLRFVALPNRECEVAVNATTAELHCSRRGDFNTYAIQQQRS